MEDGRAMVAMENAAIHVEEAQKQDEGTAPAPYQLMVDLIVLDLLQSLQAVIPIHAVSYKFYFGVTKLI